VHQGGLSATIGTDQADPVSAVDAEGDILKYGVDTLVL